MWTKSTYKRELEEKYVIKYFLICDLKICNTFTNKLWKALLADSNNRRHKNYLWIFKGSWYWYQSWKSSIQWTEYCIRDDLPNPHISLASKCPNETTKQSLSNQSDTGPESEIVCPPWNRVTTAQYSCQQWQENCISPLRFQRSDYLYPIWICSVRG